VKEISFLPNPKLGPGGRLSDAASDAARRGQTLFFRPFRNDASMSCASCHQPSSVFVDHRVHDIGTGGFFKTPTLINANFSAPYFHDGRFDSYAQVVAYFDGFFDLGLSKDEQGDLVAYLNAVGDAAEPTVRNTVQAELDEIAQFVSVLETAIPERNKEVIALTVDGVGSKWRELGEKFPARTDTSVSGGLSERLRARAAVRDMVLTLRRVAMAAEIDDFADAAAVFGEYKSQVAAAGHILKVAEAWSLFNPSVHDAHFAALKELSELAK
jgi:hypothetical protein